jgi:transcriptional regulator with XRE-family HTH domain
MPSQFGHEAFGVKLRHWRQVRNLSQLELAVAAGVSPRHLSFMETGRSAPSREMVLVLANQLRVPLREQNALLLSAGFAPVYDERPIGAPDMAAVKDAVAMVLGAHEPFPAIAVDRKWNIVQSNGGAALLAAGASPELLEPPINVYRLSLHPKGMRPRVRNFDAYALHLVARLRHDVMISGDAEIQALLDEVERYPGIRALTATRVERGVVALPLRLTTELGELSFITTTATFGTPFDITVAELAIESFFPANEETARAVRGAARS